MSRATVTERPEALSAFLDALGGAFRDATSDPAVHDCLTRVQASLAAETGPICAIPARAPTCARLAQALGPALTGRGLLATLADRLAALDASLTWRMRGGDDAAPDDLSGRIANAMIVGPGGLEARRDVWVGASLMPPGARYPEHHHAPEEIYLFLTPGRARHGGSGWFTPGPGGTLHNLPNTVHALEAPADAPMLALWALHDPRHEHSQPSVTG